MSDFALEKCSHEQRRAKAYCGSYFVECTACGSTLLTLSWFTAESLLTGELTVLQAADARPKKIAQGPAQELCPQIRGILLGGQEFVLRGPGAILHERDLGDIPHNPLPVQFEYFRRLIAANPHDETLRFALAQVARELGDEMQANNYYDEGMATANRNWLRKLPLFCLPSLLVALVIWLFSLPLWVAVFVALIGPALWFLIKRNRRIWIPMTGFTERADRVARINMAAELRSLAART